jgi:hypothetical protein
MILCEEEIYVSAGRRRMGDVVSRRFLEPTCQSCDRDQRRQDCAAPEGLDLNASARRGRRIVGCALLRGLGEVRLTSIAVARRLCFISALVEEGAFAFLATELDDAAKGAIGGVADQAKTTATVGAPFHAILPCSRYTRTTRRRARRCACCGVPTYAFQA